MADRSVRRWMTGAGVAMGVLRVAGSCAIRDELLALGNEGEKKKGVKGIGGLPCFKLIDF